MPPVGETSRSRCNRAAESSPFTVGRGPVPRRASVGETALVGVQFSRRSDARGGNPLGCAYGIRGPSRYEKKRHPLTVGRGPVPRRASVGETALAGVQFSRRSGDRGGQAPALRARKGFCHVPFGIRRSRTTVTRSFLANLDKSCKSCSSLANLVNPAPSHKNFSS